MLALTGQVGTQVLGTGNFQECDLAAAFSGVAAWSQTVQSHSRHGELISQAMKHALLERDVAHLILPDEVQNEPVAADVPASDPAGRLTPLEIAPPRASLQQALELLRGARRPVLIVGHGARFAMGPILSLIHI